MKFLDKEKWTVRPYKLKPEQIAEIERYSGKEGTRGDKLVKRVGFVFYYSESEKELVGLPVFYQVDKK